MKTLGMFWAAFLIWFVAGALLAQVEVKNGIPFKDGGKILPGLSDGKTIYNLMNEVLNGAPGSKKPTYSNIPGLTPESDFSQAWKSAKTFFDKRFIYVPTDEYFMMHGPYKGNICIVVYNTSDFRRIVENYKIFNSEQSAIAYYQKIKKEGSQEKIKEFEAKLGKLSGYFSDKKSLDKLKNKLLGKELYNQLMNALREENMHLIAGALVHEGMHAITGNAYALQEAFKSGACPIELNELRAYMAEIIYHCSYYAWAVKDVAYHWGEIDRLMGELENCRKVKPEKMTDAEKADFQKNAEKIEQIKAQIKAHIAMIRVRLKEMKESAKRINDLMGHFMKNYLKPVDSKKNQLENADQIIERIKDLFAISTQFMTDVNKAAAGCENHLKFLEGVLDEWNVYASCNRLVPPPQDTIIVKKIIDGLDFPDPPLEQGRRIKKDAEEGMTHFSVALPGKPTEPGMLLRKEPKFNLTAGAGVSSPSMTNLNNYFDYLNTTWTGDIKQIKTVFGYNLGLRYHPAKNLALGLEFEGLQSKMDGTFGSGSAYTSENRANGILGGLVAKTNPLAGFVEFMAGFSAGPYFSAYTETENAFVTKGTDSRMGWKVSGGVAFCIAPAFAVELGAGYRNLKVDDFGVTFFMPGKPQASLDYSGLFGEVKGVVKF